MTRATNTSSAGQAPRIGQPDGTGQLFGPDTPRFVGERNTDSVLFNPQALEPYRPVPRVPRLAHKAPTSVSGLIQLTSAHPGASVPAASHLLRDDSVGPTSAEPSCEPAVGRFRRTRWLLVTTSLLAGASAVPWVL